MYRIITLLLVIVTYPTILEAATQSNAPQWIITSILSIIAAILGGSIGGIITGFFTIKASNKAHQHNLELMKLQDETQIKSLIQALYDEIDTLWKRYQDGIGIKLEALPDGEPLEIYYPLTQEYFTVYIGNSFLIGKIKDHDLRRAIVKAYTKARALIDSYRMNNDILQNYIHWMWIYEETANPLHRERRNSYYNQLIEYSKGLKELHYELKEDVEKLIKMLHEQGVIYKDKS